MRHKGEKHQNLFAYNATVGGPKGSVMTDFLNNNYRRKIIPSKMYYDREDLYDQNLLVKMQSNELKEENVKLKTKMIFLQNQVREREKLVDELYRTAFITSNGTQANKNLNKDMLMLVKLKRKVQD